MSTMRVIGRTTRTSALALAAGHQAIPTLQEHGTSGAVGVFLVPVKDGLIDLGFFGAGADNDAMTFCVFAWRPHYNGGAAATHGQLTKIVSCASAKVGAEAVSGGLFLSGERTVDDPGTVVKESEGSRVTSMGGLAGFYAHADKQAALVIRGLDAPFVLVELSRGGSGAGAVTSAGLAVYEPN